MTVMKSLANVSNALRDLECGRDPCCDRVEWDLFARGIASPFDKHSAVGKPDNKRDGDGFVEVPGVEESEQVSGSSWKLRAKSSASSWSSSQSKSSLAG